MSGARMILHHRLTRQGDPGCLPIGHTGAYRKVPQGRGVPDTRKTEGARKGGPE